MSTRQWACGCGKRTRDPWEVRRPDDNPAERFLDRHIRLVCDDCGQPFVEVESI